ncbi:MAG: glycosyltransferase family 4 protein [Pseudomonadota bacterium]
MKKLCVVDLNFTWPPDGGAPVELNWILREFAKRFDTTLVLPQLERISRTVGQPWPLHRTKFFVRGRAEFSSPPPYKLHSIPLSLGEYTPTGLAAKVREHVHALSPDYVLIADGWYFKPSVVLALKEWSPVLRLFSHEMLCIKGNGILERHGRVCEIDYLKADGSNVSTCVRCALGFYARYPSPRWLFEFFRTGAFTKRYQRLCSQAFESTRAVQVGNGFIQRRLQPFVRVPVKAVPNAVDLERFVPAKAAGSSPRPFQILLAGRMDIASKGFRVAMEAFEACWRKRQDFRVRFVSNRPAPRLPFLTSAPWLPYERVGELYRNVDLLVVPSWGPDVFPNVVLEAMASGIPTIGSRVGGIQEQIADGRSGFLVEPKNPGQLSERILWAIDHPEETARMGGGARNRAERLFSIPDVFNKHYEPLFPS